MVIDERLFALNLNAVGLAVTASDKRAHLVVSVPVGFSGGCVFFLQPEHPS